VRVFSSVCCSVVDSVHSFFILSVVVLVVAEQITSAFPPYHFECRVLPISAMSFCLFCEVILFYDTIFVY
jgi:hypothetical protein